MTAAGGQPWKPRLQRLADARQLAPFERLVLELLVGCHMSPSVVRVFLSENGRVIKDNITVAKHPEFPLNHSLSVTMCITIRLTNAGEQLLQLLSCHSDKISSRVCHGHLHDNVLRQYIR